MPGGKQVEVVFDPKELMGATVQQPLKQHYEYIIASLATKILETQYLKYIDRIIIPEDFIQAVLEFQDAHCLGKPSVTDNEFGRAYGKILYDTERKKYSVFIDKQLALFILDDELFELFFSKLDNDHYNAVLNQRMLSLNILAHELSHVEFQIRVKTPDPQRSLSSMLGQQAYILLDEYFACRKAALLFPKSLADDDERFIYDLEKRISNERWDYKTGKIDLNQFCKQFHSLTEMALIRLVSVLGSFHAIDDERLPFQNTCVGKRAPIFNNEFITLYRRIMAGDSFSMPDSILNEIYTYFLDLGVEIEERSQGLYYSIPD